jgi:hypothetical protein
MTTKVYIQNFDVITATTTIANGATDSAAIDLGVATLAGLTFDSAFDGTTITFKVATASGGTFVPMVNSSGTTISYTVAASKYLPLDPAIFAGIRHFKITAGTSQTGISTITIHKRGM